VSSLDPQRRGALLAAKLAALVRAHTEADELTPGAFPDGAAVQIGDSGWVLVDRDPHRALGPALAWARRHDVASLNLVAEHDAGHLARRARFFRDPASVWTIGDGGLVAAEAVPVPPEPPTNVDRAVFEALESAGLEVIVEHGTVTGEVAGLEVARVVVAEGGSRVEVGVGVNDREATSLVHGDLPTPQILASVVETVSRERRPGAPAHPLNRLAADRWLRSRLTDHPQAIGLRTLEPRPLTFARAGLRQSYPAAAIGTDPAGRRIVIVCSIGVDLDLVPEAADVRAATGETIDGLWIVVPERDDVAVTRWMGGQLVEPADLVTLVGDWRVAIER
jgi:hypothetical protein